jgi:hypothetical protein
MGLDYLPLVSVSAPTSYKKFSARLFARGEMVCPRCRAPFPEPPDACPNCDYDFAAGVESFPFAPPALELFMNPAGLLPDDVAGPVRERYDAFRSRFPGISLSFCFIQLAPGTPLSEFAFWLFNSAPGAGDDRAWQLLLTVDLGAGRVSLNSGYALEPFIDPAQWTDPLNTCAAACAQADWTRALTRFIGDADRLLATAWKAAADKQKETGNSS